MAVALFILFLLNLSHAESIQRALKVYKSELSDPERTHALYKALNYRCLWTCQDALRIEDFEELLRDLHHHGLKREDYAVEKDVDPLLKELLLTDRLIKLSYHLYHGRIDPREVFEGWTLPREKDLPMEKLKNLVEGGRLTELVKVLSPESKEYWFLIEQSKLYTELSQYPWKPLKIKGVLKLGDKSPCVDELRFRLFLLGDLQSYEPSDVFDEELQLALKRFQRRHGLEEKGNIDSLTLKELNISPKERLNTIHLNLEKHRWLRNANTGKRIIVNIPSFELFLMEDHKVIIQSKVIVGRNYIEDFRPTPVLYSGVESLTLNPRWYVPKAIAVKDILPKVKKNVDFLRKKRIRVFYAGVELSPDAINWRALGEHNFPYTLVQEPGPWNALGRIRFNFPNPFDVYLHDTPEKYLFKREKRAFSSGCIRVEKAKQLAMEILGWSYRKLEEEISKEETRTIRLERRIPIYVLYFTAFSREGLIHFREDLYGYDRIIGQSLFGGRK
ncbi:MAG: peptidoglycan-binding protein [Acidobacteria bacterium]|nr:MAG: peptidoglycan-binding protein [Acidobacteriota bacterium]